MFSNIICAALCGMGVIPVQIQADISNGFPSYTMVGYLSSEVRESRERVTAALKNCGYRIPAKRITVNLAPADFRKGGTAFDLPVAVAILTSLGALSKDDVADIAIFGELSLDGTVLPVRGILPMVNGLLKEGVKRFIIPEGNSGEGRLIKDAEVWCAGRLDDVPLILAGKKERLEACDVSVNTPEYEEDISDIESQSVLKRGLEIAAAGRHSFLMVGPPGAGKTMTAERIRSILPEMSGQEVLEVSEIYSAAGLLPAGGMITERPFRAPEPSVSERTVTGAGHLPVPGEISLAHRGVLFMDEMEEFRPAVLDAVRKTLEEKFIAATVNRRSAGFPCDYMLIGAMNPCRCGYYPDRNKCVCSRREIELYRRKISGPLLDRIDMTLAVENVRISDTGAKTGVSSAELRDNVKRAWDIQRERGYRGGDSNSSMTQADIKKHCAFTADAESMLTLLAAKKDLSMRGMSRVVKVSRTIADLAGSSIIDTEHVAEAFSYRGITTDFWRI
ncbi:MAG: YifB family Mg chelatase-like AAA ATPase [Lachnospiraceae bacterium]|nr:YifB family Mg chelatase-like AAA ATPase [Lachnospiraceae bacterium]